MTRNLRSDGCFWRKLLALDTALSVRHNWHREFPHGDHQHQFRATAPAISSSKTRPPTVGRKFALGAIERRITAFANIGT